MKKGRLFSCLAKPHERTGLHQNGDCSVKLSTNPHQPRGWRCRGSVHPPRSSPTGTLRARHVRSVHCLRGRGSTGRLLRCSIRARTNRRRRGPARPSRDGIASDRIALLEKRPRGVVPTSISFRSAPSETAVVVQVAVCKSIMQCTTTAAPSWACIRTTAQFSQDPMKQGMTAARIKKNAIRSGSNKDGIVWGAEDSLHPVGLRNDGAWRDWVANLGCGDGHCERMLRGEVLFSRAILRRSTRASSRWRVATTTGA